MGREILFIVTGVGNPVMYLMEWCPLVIKQITYK